MNAIGGRMAVGPVTLSCTAAHLVMAMNDRRRHVQRVILRRMTSGEAGLTDHDREVLADVDRVRTEMGRRPILDGGLVAAKLEIDRSLRLMSLHEDQVPGLAMFLVDFWRCPRGCYVYSRVCTIRGQRHQIVHAGDPNDDDSREFELLERVFRSGMDSAAGIW